VKWGFKVWVCAESGSRYALNVDVYTGKTTTPDRALARATHGLGYEIVDYVTSQYQLKNHIIYYDRYFSSVALAEYLRTVQTYSVSTVQMNRAGLPTEAKGLKLKVSGEIHEYERNETA